MDNQGLCIVPARGGSKRFPRKNLAKLGGQSLVERAIDAALESNLFSRVVLSSDDDEILTLGEPYGAKVEPIKRDAKLATDNATALELVCEITKQFSNQHSFVALLLPTAPLRTSTHLVEGFKKMMLSDEIDGVVSLTTYEFPPQLSIVLENEFIKPVFSPCPLIEGNTRSQDQALIYRPNGAFYMQKLPSFSKNQNFWKGNVVGYVMDRKVSADIDSAFDLKVASLLIDETKLN
ncbi:hypothetical protein CL656_05050 [bacterium]|nr:hypothetical protein [bacterium]